MGISDMAEKCLRNLSNFLYQGRAQYSIKTDEARFFEKELQKVG